MSRRLTQSEFIARANSAHNNKYDYSKFEYVNSHFKSTIICPIHGKFEQTPNSHLKRRGCPECSPTKKKTLEQFVNKANIVHNNKYNYIKFEYINASTKGTIVCPIHGDFEKTPDNHLSGAQCPKCGTINSGWSRTAFIKRCQDNKAIFYILKCYTPDKSELFYKVGITSKNVKTRYRSKQAMPYIYEIVQESVGTPEQVMELEYSTKKSLKPHHYSPKINFNGSATECFSSIEIL